MMPSYQIACDRRLRVGVVGTGSHTYRNLLPALTYLPVELKAVCNFSNAERGRDIARQYGCRYWQGAAQMYAHEDLDAVIICVSPYRHADLAIEALECGLHVFMEKPAAAASADVLRMMRARGDRVVTVGYKKAFMPATDKAIEVLGSDGFDEARSLLAVYPVHVGEAGEGAAVVKDRWLANSCHPLSFAVATMGPVASIEVVRGAQGNTTCILEFESGATGTLHGATGPQPCESYQLFGGTWNMRVDNCDTVSLNRGVPFEYGRSTSYAPAGLDHGQMVWHPQMCLSTLENRSEFIQGIHGELSYFCERALGVRSEDAAGPAARAGMPRGSLEFALHLTRIYEAALRSCGRRERV